jgi:DNA integrity scanning protein DisA with diadenylate cyclase activity
MRNYIYKTIIAIIAFVIVFEFTIGKTLNKITSQTDTLLTREGRKEMINSIKNEMNKAVKKENFLKQDERILINTFINKIKNELKNVE